MADTIRVLGLEQAKRNLQTLSDKLQNSIVRAAMRQAANVFLKATRAGTYGGGRMQRTGLLLRSQSVSSGKRGDVISAKVRMREVNVGGTSAFAKGVRSARGIKQLSRTVTRRGKTTTKPVSMRAFYWWFLEKGTKRIAPRPWVVPAFQAHSGGALDAFGESLTRRLEDEANKLPKGVSK